MSCATESHAYVIFGATGNLAMAKLLPALYQLHRLGLLARRDAPQPCQLWSQSQSDHRGAKVDSLRPANLRRLADCRHA